MKKETYLLVLFFLCTTTISFSQKQNRTEVYRPTNYFISVSDSALSVKGIRIVDSLLKLKNDSAIIEYHSGGDISINEVFHRLYKDTNAWRFDSEGKETKDVIRSPLWLKGAPSLIPTKDIMYQNADYRSSSHDNYYYLLIVNDKIVASILSNVEISEIAEVDPALSMDVNFFKKFDEYIKTPNL